MTYLDLEHDLLLATAAEAQSDLKFVERAYTKKSAELAQLRTDVAALASWWRALGGGYRRAGNVEAAAISENCADALEEALRGRAEPDRCQCGTRLKKYTGAGATGLMCPECDAPHARELEVVR